MSPKDAVGVAVVLAVVGALVCFVAVLIYRVVRITVAGRRADRAFAEARRLRESGEIDAVESIRRINEAHDRFQREA
jgi:hypothetical protein